MTSCEEQQVLLSGAGGSAWHSSGLVPVAAWRRVFWVFVAFLTCVTTLPGQAGTDVEEREYAVKAAFLFHLAQFIEWPEERLPENEEPIRICILGPDPFGGMLEEIVTGETVATNPILVEYHDSLDTLAGCHILFIPERAGSLGQAALSHLRGEPVLLVGENLQFISDGGMLALLRDGNRVAIVLSRTALEGARLNASSRLLRLARIVGNS